MKCDPSLECEFDLDNKYMDDGLLALAREISRRRIHESAVTPQVSSPDAPTEQP